MTSVGYRPPVSVPASGGTFTGEVIAPDFKATGKTGSTVASVLGGGTAALAPVSGAHVVNELFASTDGSLWICTVAGTPGTWVRANHNLVDAKGDLLVGTADNTMARRAVGNPGERLVADPTDTTGLSWTKFNPYAPAAAISETMPRVLSAISANTVLTSGLLRLSGLPLWKGQVVTSLTFHSHTGSAISASTHLWFSLWGPGDGLTTFPLLAVTTDDTAAAPWAANAAKTLALTAPYTVPVTGLYYAGILNTAGTPVTILRDNNLSGPNAIAPIVSCVADSGLTTPASAPPNATFSSIGVPIYAYAS